MTKYRKKPVVIEAEQYSKKRHVDEGYLPNRTRTGILHRRRWRDT